MDVRISRVETIVVNARMRNWVFVKVTTDQAGLVGWGEATLEWKTRAVVGAVADLAAIVVDRTRAASSTSTRRCTETSSSRVAL